MSDSNMIKMNFGSTGIKISPDGKKVILNVQDPTATKIDIQVPQQISPNSVSATLKLAFGTTSIEITPDGKHIIVKPADIANTQIDIQSPNTQNVDSKLEISKDDAAKAFLESLEEPTERVLEPEPEPEPEAETLNQFAQNALSIQEKGLTKNVHKKHTARAKYGTTCAAYNVFLGVYAGFDKETGDKIYIMDEDITDFQGTMVSEGGIIKSKISYNISYTKAFQCAMEWTKVTNDTILVNSKNYQKNNNKLNEQHPTMNGLFDSFEDVVNVQWRIPTSEQMTIIEENMSDILANYSGDEEAKKRLALSHHNDYWVKDGQKYGQHSTISLNGSVQITEHSGTEHKANLRLIRLVR